MPRHQIRAAQSQDLAPVVELNRRTGLSEWSSKDYEEAILSDRFLFLIIDSAENQGNQILGFALAAIVGEEMELFKLSVDPVEQGRGLGGTLLRETLERGLESGCKRCFLEVSADNHTAINLYRRYGFVEVHRRKNYYSHPLRDALVMESPLEEFVRRKSRGDTVL